MKTRQWTPGPWAMHPIYTKGTLTHWGINGVNDTGTQFTSGRIVDVPRNAPNHDGPTQEANALLMSLAPEMAKIIEDIVLWDMAKGIGRKKPAPLFPFIVANARAVLAKLEGGQA